MNLDWTMWTRRALAVAAGVAVGAPLAYAQNSYSEYAPVISSTPVIARVSQPQEQCSTERVWTTETRRLGGIQLGALDTTTNVQVPVQRDVQHCRTVDGYSDVIQGYDVLFRYNGREYTTHTDYDPGDRIRVDVNVMPNLR